MVSVINKLKTFSEWHDMDDRLAKALQHSVKKTEAMTASQGRSFAQFASKQPEEVQSSLTQANELIKRTQVSVKAGDDLIPKIRSSLNRMRPLNEDIKAKRKATQATRERADKSSKKSASTGAKLEALRTRNPAHPDVTKLQEEHNRALAQFQADQETFDKRAAQFATEQRDYKKELILVVLSALEDFANGKAESISGLVSIGEELAGVGAQVPFFTDTGKEQLQVQLQTLRDEPLE
jgi:hypothetical protein